MNSAEEFFEYVLIQQCLQFFLSFRGNIWDRDMNLKGRSHLAYRIFNWLPSVNPLSSKSMI